MITAEEAYGLSKSIKLNTSETFLEIFDLIVEEIRKGNMSCDYPNKLEEKDKNHLICIGYYVKRNEEKNCYEINWGCTEDYRDYDD